MKPRTVMVTVEMETALPLNVVRDGIRSYLDGINLDGSGEEIHVRQVQVSIAQPVRTKDKRKQ